MTALWSHLMLITSGKNPTSKSHNGSKGFFSFSASEWGTNFSLHSDGDVQSTSSCSKVTSPVACLSQCSSGTMFWDLLTKPAFSHPERSFSSVSGSLFSAQQGSFLSSHALPLVAMSVLRALPHAWGLSSVEAARGKIVSQMCAPWLNMLAG